ncbi:MAG: hypothetical protein PUE51_06730 [Veillonellaceae bacterium]|nr:hypothetical protein [Veillonellaceae bacterium]
MAKNIFMKQGCKMPLIVSFLLIVSILLPMHPAFAETIVHNQRTYPRIEHHESKATSDSVAEETASSSQDTAKAAAQQKESQSAASAKTSSQPLPQKKVARLGVVYVWNIKTPLTDRSKAEKIKKLSKGVDVRQDAIQNIVYYRPKKVSPDPISFYPVIHLDQDRQQIRLYWNAIYSDSWTSSTFHGINVTLGSAEYLNFHTVSVRADGKIYEMQFAPSHRHVYDSVDVAPIQTWYYQSMGRTVAEYYEEPMDANAFQLFRAITNASNVMVRFSGNDKMSQKAMSPKKLEIERKMYDLFLALIS